MRVVIVGAGNVGRSIARELLQNGHSVLLIDRDPHAMNTDSVPDADWLLADACELDSLKEARLETADVSVAATGDDKANLVHSLLAKTEFGVPRTVSRVNHPRNEWMFNEVWGVDIAVSTPRLISALVEEAVTVGDLVRLLGGRQLFLQVEQTLLVWGGQRVLVGGKPLAPLVQLARLLFHAALLGRQHLNLLLHLRDGAALLGGLRLRTAQRVFQVRQGLLLLFQLCRQRDLLVFRLDGVGGQVFDFCFSLCLALGPLGQLLFELQRALLGALAAFDDEADLRLQPAHLGTGLVQQALRAVDLIARRVMRLADGLQIGFDVAQVGHARFEVVDGLFRLGLEPDLPLFSLGALQKP